VGKSQHKKCKPFWILNEAVRRRVEVGSGWGQLWLSEGWD